MRKDEHQLLVQALAAASQTTGLNITEELAGGSDVEHGDTLVTVRGAGTALSLPVEITRSLNNANLGPTVARVRKRGHLGLLVAPHINRNLAERLRDLNIAFMDAAGNLFIDVPPLLLYVVGQPLLHRQTSPVSAFNPMGLQVIFTLLSMPEHISKPYRDIANAAGVSLGTVGKTIPALERSGFIGAKGDHGKTLLKTGELTHRWAQDYAERLRPRLVLGRFSPVDPDWRHAAGQDHFLGGETAAAYLTDYLKPTTYSVFLKGELKDFVLANKLRKDPQGSVECLQAFWRFRYPWEHEHLAPPLLIYADLLATGDGRNIETAEIIHERFLAGRLG